MTWGYTRGLDLARMRSSHAAATAGSRSSQGFPGKCLKKSRLCLTSPVLEGGLVTTAERRTPRLQLQSSLLRAGSNAAAAEVQLLSEKGQLASGSLYLLPAQPIPKVELLSGRFLFLCFCVCLPIGCLRAGEAEIPH